MARGRQRIVVCTISPMGASPVHNCKHTPAMCELPSEGNNASGNGGQWRAASFSCCTCNAPSRIQRMMHGRSVPDLFFFFLRSDRVKLWSLSSLVTGLCTGRALLSMELYYYYWWCAWHVLQGTETWFGLSICLLLVNLTGEENLSEMAGPANHFDTW